MSIYSDFRAFKSAELISIEACNHYLNNVDMSDVMDIMDKLVSKLSDYAVVYDMFDSSMGHSIRAIIEQVYLFKSYILESSRGYKYLIIDHKKSLLEK